MDSSLFRAPGEALRPVLLLVSVVLAVCTAGIGTAAPAQNATVGDPKKPAELPQAVQEAYKSGARRITIRPGTYLLPKSRRQSVCS